MTRSTDAGGGRTVDFGTRTAPGPLERSKDGPRTLRWAAGGGSPRGVASRDAGRGAAVGAGMFGGAAALTRTVTSRPSGHGARKGQPLVPGWRDEGAARDLS